ncbi:MAG: putative lipid II flippase FtsW [Deltaproteobacteria bacterium]
MRQTEVAAPDPILLWAVLALTALGLVMVYSASAVTAKASTGDELFYLKRQAVAAAIGILALVGAVRMGHLRLAPLAYPLLVLALLGLGLVLVPGIGASAGGARRWIRLPGASFQPAELAKLSFVVYLAHSLSKKREKVRSFSIGFLPHCLVGALLVCLLMLEPDFGSSVTIGLLLFALLFAAGARISWLVGSLLLALPVGWFAIAHSPYRMKRILAFLDPWAHRHDIGYQVAESLMSIGSGGLTGLGLGDGRQKLFFLPEAHTDFIFSIIGEELGFLGAALVIALYAIIVWRGVRAALRASDSFGAYLAFGLTALLGLGASVNLGVAMGLLPTKGLTLPFVSYGGTSLIGSLFCAGTLLSVSRCQGGFLVPQRPLRNRPLPPVTAELSS